MKTFKSFSSKWSLCIILFITLMIVPAVSSYALTEKENSMIEAAAINGDLETIANLTQSKPEEAILIARIAATFRPDMADVIAAQVAAVVHPSFAAEIAAEVAKIFPKYAASIATRVAGVVDPKYAADIAGRVADVAPDQAHFIAKGVISATGQQYADEINQKIMDAIGPKTVKKSEADAEPSPDFQQREPKPYGK